MRAVFLVGENPFDCCTVFSSSLASALEKLGWKVELVFLSKKDGFQGLQSLFLKSPDITLSFSDIHLEQNSLGTFWSVPHVSLLLDPLLYSLHQCVSENCYVTVIDKIEVDFLEQQKRKTLFFPHAVDRDFAYEPEEEKTRELVFFGTLIEPALLEKRWRDFFSSRQVKELKNIAEEYYSSPYSLLEILQKEEVPTDLWPTYHFEVDQYTRMKERVELLQECQDLSLSIWGTGPFKKFCPRAQVFPPCSFTETMKFMKQAKVLLNSSIRFKHGAHERIYFGMAAKAVVVTGSYPYISTQFEEGKEFIGFYPHKLKGLSDRIREFLDSTEKKEMVQSAWTKVVNRDTFDQRALELKKFCQSL